jgi:Protein of unknown function (DUF3300)
MKRVRFASAFLTIISVAAFAQTQPPPPQTAPPLADQAAPLASPQQLDDLVAPIALYPDPIMTQILVASTYPLEIVEANQWLQQNGNLTGQALMDAARAQNWDPSVQALVAFPDVLTRLTQNVRWTTDLGNAFLAQQEDVMTAVQRMRGRAKANGKLNSTPQETVTEQRQGDQTAIAIQPANPQVIYVPSYNPDYIWGPPAYGYYPPLLYPGIGFGFGFGPGIYIGGFFGGCCGWGGLGWGWGPNWFGGGILVNNYFFHRYGFADGFHGGEFRGTSAWAHDPGHRMGVPYANRGVAARYQGAGGARGGFRGGAGASSFNRGGAGANRGNVGAARTGAAARPASPQGQRFGSPGFERQNSGGNRSAFGGVQNGGQTRVQSDHGFSSMGHMSGGSRGGGAPRSSGGGHRGR